ncbi:hypothetical protein ENBRE01_3328 [Enteropsectra breve]|nr:hypothetical protein ENBRE01_3328 [Enteropsectra breve]
MSENFKWIVTMTEKLIRAKHSGESCRMFDEAMNKPKKTKLCWQRLADEFGMSISGDAVKIKYNQLLAKYRDVLMERSRYGAAAPKWKYWEVFQSTFPANIHHIMPNVVELGDDSVASCTANCMEEDSFHTTEFKRPNSYRETKNKVYEAMLKCYESKNLSRLN